MIVRNIVMKQIFYNKAIKNNYLIQLNRNRVVPNKHTLIFSVYCDTTNDNSIQGGVLLCLCVKRSIQNPNVKCRLATVFMLNKCPFVMRC